MLTVPEATPRRLLAKPGDTSYTRPFLVTPLPLTVDSKEIAPLSLTALLEVETLWPHAVRSLEVYLAGAIFTSAEMSGFESSRGPAAPAVSYSTRWLRW